MGPIAIISFICENGPQMDPDHISFALTDMLLNGGSAARHLQGFDAVIAIIKNKVANEKFSSRGVALLISNLSKLGFYEQQLYQKLCEVATERVSVFSCPEMANVSDAECRNDRDYMSRQQLHHKKLLTNPN